MSDYDMGDGGHVFLHLLSRSAPIEKEPPQGGFFFVPETLSSLLEFKKYGMIVSEFVDFL